MSTKGLFRPQRNIYFYFSIAGVTKKFFVVKSSYATGSGKDFFHPNNTKHFENNINKKTKNSSLETLIPFIYYCYTIYYYSTPISCLSKCIYYVYM